jgi:4,5-dihydroxyphthalate decarboxylase
MDCPLAIAGYKFDRVAALADGRVAIEGCDVHFETARISDMNTDVFSGPQSRDVTEIGLHPFMLAHANEGFRDYNPATNLSAAAVSAQERLHTK